MILQVSVCPQGACMVARGRVWLWGGACMAEEGACVVGRACVAGDVHGLGDVHVAGVWLWGVCGLGACMAGGMCGWGAWHTCPPDRYYGYGMRSMSGRYASYWNAFLFSEKS